jgi:hypothetical protein
MGRPSLSQIKRAKEQAQLHGRWGALEKLNELEHQIHAERAYPPEDPAAVQEDSSSNNWSEGLKDQILSTAAKHTDLALSKVSSSDYKYKCKSCGAKPSVAGPHHDDSVPKIRGHWQSVLLWPTATNASTAMPSPMSPALTIAGTVLAA